MESRMDDVILLHPHPDIAQLLLVLDRFTQMKTTEKRREVARELFELAVPMRQEIPKLELRLDVGMTWLGENEGAPEHAQREEKWNRWEERYRALVDALEKVRHVTNRLLT